MNEKHEEITVRLGFDPLADAKTREIFADDTARTLYLLWRRGHIVSEYFPKDCLAIAARIRDAKPQSARELAECFPWGMFDFTAGDIDRFCPEAIPFFRGKQKVDWTVDAPAPRQRELI